LALLLIEHHTLSFAQLNETISAIRQESGSLPDLLPILSELSGLPEAFSNALRTLPFSAEQLEAALGQKVLNHVYRSDRQLSRLDARILGQRLERMAGHYRDFLDQNAKWIRARIQEKLIEHVNLSSLSATQLNSEQKLFKKNYATGRRELEHEFGKTMRYKSIRDLAAGPSGQVIQDLKPIWLMSPLSVSDTLPLHPDLFDVVIFDEASQIPLEEAIPALYRSHQVIVVGDEMQLPPTTFFASSRPEDESVIVEEEGERIEVDLDADSFLTQSGQNLSSTLLAWHYRSRYESLISFSNAAFYSGNLFTIPDRQLPSGPLPELRVTAPDQGSSNARALLQRSLSFHFIETGVYEQRRNFSEASYIAHLVRALLNEETGLSIGIVAFSEAQQTAIEEALEQLGNEDEAFANRLEAEYTREENDQFCGLIIKNLENVQGDERDIIILSICYGYDANRRMLMNFGPINQKGGEKRLNVIFSRAKHHMAVVSSIRHSDITNDYNDGANSLRNFLEYAEAVSKGDATSARRVLENLNPLARKSLTNDDQRDAVVEQLARALRECGWQVDAKVGQSRFRCDLAIRGAADGYYQLGILVDTAAHYANADLLERYLMRPAILHAFGWRFALVLTKDWLEDPQRVLDRLLRLIQQPETGEAAEELEPIEPEREPAAAMTNPGPPISSTPRPVMPTAAPVLPGASRITGIGGTKRYFEFVSGASNKFWEVSLDEASVSVRFGRIGTPGQTQAKVFADSTRAKSEAEKLIREKLAKGYEEKS
jgi:predicted DNA-binding WGR domain protein